MLLRPMVPARLAISGWSLALLAVMPLVARGEIYICKDSGGRTITSDRPVPECAKQVLRVMSDGLVRREIAAPLTPEQRRQKELEQDKQRADAIAAEEQRQLDRILLTRYRSELDIEAARQHALQPGDELIGASYRAIGAAEKQQASAKAESELAKNKPLLGALRRKQEDAAHTILHEQKNIHDQGLTIADVNAKYDAALKRYRELRGSEGAKPAASTSVDSSGKAPGKK